jgi:hypothetical protein
VKPRSTGQGATGTTAGVNVSWMWYVSSTHDNSIR